MKVVLEHYCPKQHSGLSLKMELNHRWVANIARTYLHPYGALHIFAGKGRCRAKCFHKHLGRQHAWCTVASGGLDDCPVPYN